MTALDYYNYARSLNFHSGDDVMPIGFDHEKHTELRCLCILAEKLSYSVDTFCGHLITLNLYAEDLLLLAVRGHGLPIPEYPLNEINALRKNDEWKKYYNL